LKLEIQKKGASMNLPFRIQGVGLCECLARISDHLEVFTAMRRFSSLRRASPWARGKLLDEPMRRARSG